MLKIEREEETIVELKNIYNRVLDDTIRLINNYNLKTPVEIFGLFYYIVKKYLETMDNIEMYPKKLENADTKGIAVLVDGGVCRHRSAMLNDIYSKMNIDSIPIGGYAENLLEFHYCRRGKDGFKNSMYESMLRQRLNEGANLEDFKPGLKRHKMTYGINEKRKQELQENPRLGNHAIIMVGNDKKNYFDSMNGESYSCFPYSDDLDILSNCSGAYFFFYHDAHKKIIVLRKENFSEYNEKFKRINRLECANEVENKKIIKGLMSRFRYDYALIEEYINDNANNVETIKDITKTLRKELSK